MALSCCDSSYDRIPQWLFNHSSCTKYKYKIRNASSSLWGRRVMAIRYGNTFLLATQHQNNSLKITTLQYLTRNYLCISENCNTNNFQLKRQGNQWKQVSCTKVLQPLLQIIRQTNTDSREEGKYFCKTREELNKAQNFHEDFMLCLNLAIAEHLVVPANSSDEIQ